MAKKKERSKNIKRAIVVLGEKSELEGITGEKYEYLVSDKDGFRPAMLTFESHPVGVGCSPDEEVIKHTAEVAYRLHGADAVINYRSNRIREPNQYCPFFTYVVYCTLMKKKIP